MGMKSWQVCLIFSVPKVDAGKGGCKSAVYIIIAVMMILMMIIIVMMIRIIRILIIFRTYFKILSLSSLTMFVFYIVLFSYIFQLY